VKEDNMGWTRSVALMVKKMTDKPEGKRQLGKFRRRWKENIEMNLRGTEWSDMDWIHLAQNVDQCRTVVNTVMNLRVPQNFGKFLSS
jgi:hypothetical protein